MSIRRWMFDTDLAKVKALVGSCDTRAINKIRTEHCHEYGQDPDSAMVEALVGSSTTRKFDNSNEHDHWAAYWMAQLHSRNLTSYDGETKRWAFSNLAEWLRATAGDARLSQLADQHGGLGSCRLLRLDV